MTYSESKSDQIYSQSENISQSSSIITENTPQFRDTQDRQNQHNMSSCQFSSEEMCSKITQEKNENDINGIKNELLETKSTNPDIESDKKIEVIQEVDMSRK